MRRLGCHRLHLLAQAPVARSRGAVLQHSAQPQPRVRHQPYLLVLHLRAATRPPRLVPSRAPLRLHHAPREAACGHASRLRRHLLAAAAQGAPLHPLCRPAAQRGGRHFPREDLPRIASSRRRASFAQGDGHGCPTQPDWIALRLPCRLCRWHCRVEGELPGRAGLTRNAQLPREHAGALPLPAACARAHRSGGGDERHLALPRAAASLELFQSGELETGAVPRERLHVRTRRRGGA
mmetsp:Transcript_39348/g.69200  ORF Transcript_39348/g.69200 Transcript_39348/m.69200 type:complete len:237 (-) Transcript_39348:20-730(-)